MRGVLGAVVAALLCAANANAAESSFDIAVQAARTSPRVSGRLPLFYRARPSVSGAWLPASPTAPVVVELTRAPTRDDIVRLGRAGLEVSLREDGTPVARGRFVAGRVRADDLEKLAAEVVRVVPDGAPFGHLPPLDEMAAELQAPDVWRQLDAAGLPIAGAGQVVCVIDVGIDVYHPMFFRPDGGFWAWRDVDGDGVFTSGVDTLRDGTVLRTYDSVVFDYAGGTLYGSAKGHIAGIDWLYADDNGNGRRDMGPAAGYGDDSPSFGEPLFTSDDVDGDAVLDAGERLVALGTSKVLTYTTGAFIHQRGATMSEAPREGSHHGTAASSIVAGGQRGLSRFVGIAPDADLMVVKTSAVSELFNHTDFCLNRGARVILHEYAPWQGFFLDGSSPLEQVVSSSMAAGVAHINPAGNLAGAKKMYEGELGRGATVDIPIEVPAEYDGEAFGLFGFSLLWRGDPGDLEITLTDGAGETRTVADESDQQPFHSGLSLVTDRERSPRGTSRADIYVFGDQEGTVKIASGSWTVSVRDRALAGPLELVASVQDDRSRWDVGIHFPESASQAHLIGHPGTADDAIVVAAYVGQGFLGGVPGARSEKSGRGTRIDGVELLSIAAPEDPIAAAHFEEQPAPMGPFSGTSGASPFVAGAAALLFQQDPTRTGLDVREAIRTGALADADTGPVPNVDWGFGKLRIHRSLYGVDPPEGSPPEVTIPITHVDAGETVTIRAAISDPDGDALVVELDRDYDGVFDEVLEEGTFSVSYGSVGPRFLKVRVTDASGRTAAALARVEVHSTALPSGGCRLGPAPVSPWSALPWLLLAALGRRRGRSRRLAVS